MVAAIGATQRSVYPLDNGTTLDFDEALGRWIIISYWASWCGPCREEIRVLNSIHRERERRHVIVLGVNFDGVQGKKLAQQKERWGAKYADLLVDPRERWDEPRPDFIPRTLVIDPAGKLKAALSGTTSRSELLDLISNGYEQDAPE